jgi:hypothetical protein
MQSKEKNMAKFNKGEWSELLVFLSVLFEGKIHAADEDLNKIDEIFYVVLKAIRNNIEYVLENHNQLRIINTNDREFVVSTKEFEDEIQVLYNKIKNTKGSSFEIPEIQPLLEQLGIVSIKANSTSKGDLTIQIHDTFTGFKPTIDFSIKSYIGNAPTLLNASGATVFTYLVNAPYAENLIDDTNKIQGTSKIKDRISFLNSQGVELQFSKSMDETFCYNLQMIDFRMPEILAGLVLISYFVKGKKMNDVVDLFCEKFKENKELIEHKVKDLLVAIALGMVPKTKWLGIDEANGGYVIVKPNGDIVCYHIYDRNRLRNYLYKNTKFDSPSSSRTGAGLLIKEDDGVKFRLTCQIRF